MNDEKKCEKVSEVTSALCAEELSPEESREIHEHASECDHCGRLLSAMRYTWHLLDHWKEPSAPKDSVKKFRKRFAEAHGIHLSPWGSLHSLSGGVLFIPGAAVAALVLFLVFSDIGFVDKSSPTPSSNIAATEPDSNTGVVASAEFDETSDDGYNLIPRDVRIAGAMSVGAQRSVGVLIDPVGASTGERTSPEVSSDILRVVPVGYRH